MKMAAMQMGDFLRRHRGDFAVILGILVGVFVVYSVLSISLYRSSDQPFLYFDILFELDVPRAMESMTVPSADHYRTVVHPLYVLFVNPFGSVLAGLGIGGERHAHALAAIALNSLFGAGSAAVAYLLFRNMGRGKPDALLLSAVFAFSMSQVFLSIVPDTSSLATLSLLVTYLAFWLNLSWERMPLAVWVVAGIFSFGVTTTNFAQTLICFCMAQVFDKKLSLRLNVAVLKRLAQFGGAVLIGIFALAALQKLIYPSSVFFFDLSAYSEDFEYASLLIFEQPLTVLGLLFKHVFLVNIAAPFPHGYDIGEPLLAVTFASSWAYHFVGYIALVLWICFGLYCIVLKNPCGLRGFISHARAQNKFCGTESHKDRRNILFYLGLTACLVFNILLHSFYGVAADGRIEYFLYTGNFTFAVIVLLLGQIAITSKIRYGLALLLVSMAANNLLVANSLIQFYSGG